MSHWPILLVFDLYIETVRWLSLGLTLIINLGKIPILLISVLIVDQIIKKLPEEVAKSQEVCPDVDCFIMNDKDTPDTGGQTKGWSVPTCDVGTPHRVWNISSLDQTNHNNHVCRYSHNCDNHVCRYSHNCGWLAVLNTLYIAFLLIKYAL